jgi:hypothetical protein
MKPADDSDSETEKPAENKEEKPAGPKSESAPTKPTKEESPSEKPAETAEKPSDEKAKADAASKEQEAEAERQAKLQELVESKKYFVKIDDSKAAPVKTFVLTVMAVLIVGAVALAVLIDAGIVDLGIGLPFDLIK